MDVTSSPPLAMCPHSFQICCRMYALHLVVKFNSSGAKAALLPVPSGLPRAPVDVHHLSQVIELHGVGLL